MLLLSQLIGVLCLAATLAAVQHVAAQDDEYHLNEKSGVDIRCAFTKGDWCKEYHAAKPVPWKIAPRGNKPCLNDCNGMGICNYDIGYCNCPAGTTGDDCSKPLKRPCTAHTRNPDDRSDEPMSHIGPDKRDVNFLEEGKTYSRCAGICDDDVASCFCDGPMGRIPPPEGSKPGSPPIKKGRPLVTWHSHPKHTKDGRKMWGDLTWDHVYGPRGYCNVTKPDEGIGCQIDGFAGPYCDEEIEQMCPNQCAGHGTCYLGFCFCDKDWYGHDCARKKAGLPLEPSRIPQHHWLQRTVVEPPAALEPPPAPTRRKPLIYVYDLEPVYQARMLQYRIPASWCVHRRYGDNNHTVFTDNWVYAVDMLLHESMLQSPHRTFDPEEADFFYVPHAATCFPFPILGWADFPWFHVPNGGPRVMHAANIILDTKRWIQKHFPYWDRRGGRDHIWLFTHDEGACWAPNEVNSSVWLTHWGRMGLNHTSNTAFEGDNYSFDFKNWRVPRGWHTETNILGHPCYNPEKDLVLPSFKAPWHYNRSPLAGSPPRIRDILLYFRGDVGKGRHPNYSRGVRQKVYNMAHNLGWKEKYNVLVGDGRDVPGDYSVHLSRAKFCLVAGGDGWSARMEDAMLHGCIPVIIQDNVHAPLESILDVASFAVRLPEADTDSILDRLLAIPEEKVQSMQAALGHVWNRFRWAHTTALELAARNLQRENLGHARELPPNTNEERILPTRFRGDPTTDDIFETILQWLHSRIPHTRG